jgi:hypothetical protein
MTTLNLPNEIINKIFSYIEGNNNQLIKKEFVEIKRFYGDCNRHHITFTMDLIKRTFIKNQLLSNNKAIEYDKYFKYSIFNNNRKFLSQHIREVRNLINEYNYNNYYNNYTLILQQIRLNYINDYYYKYELTRKQLKEYHNVHFKYTFLHENRTKICIDIKRYNTRRHNVVDKKLSKKILLERGILFQQINTKR